MAFQANKLELLAGGGVILNLWGYSTDADSKAQVDAAGYFNGAAGVLKVGDWVFVNASDGRGLVVVTENAAGVVDVSDVLPVGATDSR